jgi:hypothetical protein
MSTVARLEALWHRLELEGRYTDANIIHLAIEEITKKPHVALSRDGNDSPTTTHGRKRHDCEI